MRNVHKNKANRTKLQENIAKYKKQRNLVVKLNRDSKLRYFYNIETSKYSKPFWNVCKPYFSNKHAHGDSKIILIENEKITNNSNEVVKKETFQNHPSIIKLKSKYNFQEKFSFKPVPVKYVESIIKIIPNNRAAGGKIPLHILKRSSFPYQMLADCINGSLSQGIFPDSLKLVNITPVHKNDETTDKENYRPVSVLPLFSKIFEKIIYDQLSQYLEKYLNNLLCGFRKVHSSQHALFKLLQAWQEELDKSGFVGTILMDLSKAYDSLPHDLLVAKFEAYGIDKNGLNLIHNYLTNRKQRTKISSSYSEWYDIVRGAPQGSILGPLLFNLFNNDLFLFIERTNICNFADDNTIYSCNINLQTILKDLKYDMQNILKWFKVNSVNLIQRNSNL